MQLKVPGSNFRAVKIFSRATGCRNGRETRLPDRAEGLGGRRMSLNSNVMFSEDGRPESITRKTGHN